MRCVIVLSAWLASTALAFGADGDAKRKIPANADLLFHMELVEFSRGRGGL